MIAYSVNMYGKEITMKRFLAGITATLASITITATILCPRPAGTVCCATTRSGPLSEATQAHNYKSGPCLWAWNWQKTCTAPTIQNYQTTSFHIPSASSSCNEGLRIACGPCRISSGGMNEPCQTYKGKCGGGLTGFPASVNSHPKKTS